MMKFIRRCFNCLLEIFPLVFNKIGGIHQRDMSAQPPSIYPVSGDIISDTPLHNEPLLVIPDIPHHNEPLLVIPDIPHHSEPLLVIPDITHHSEPLLVIPYMTYPITVSLN